MMMERKERMKHANSYFDYGGRELTLKQKERLIAIFCDEDRLQCSDIHWYFMIPSRLGYIDEKEWAKEILWPDRHTLCTINAEVWFEEEPRKEFMEWFEQLQNRLNDYKNTIPSFWKKNSRHYSNKELNSEEIEFWYNILINSSEYRFTSQLYEFMVENFQ